MRLCFLLFIFIFNNKINSQNWEYYINGPKNGYPFSLIETYDNGIIFNEYGHISSNPINLYKLDVNGQILWNRAFKFKNQYLEVFNICQLKNQKGYLINGSLAYNEYHAHPYILKLNNCFEVEWFKIFKENETFRRVFEIIEYQDNYLVQFSYLIPNQSTIVMMSKSGKILKKLTIPATELAMKVSKNGLIHLIGDSYPEGIIPSRPHIGVNKSIYLLLDSNLKVKKLQYFHHYDSLFYNNSRDMCFIDESETSFLTVSQDRSRPELAGGNMMITKNHDDNWYKTFGDTNYNSGGGQIIRLINNRYVFSYSYENEINRFNAQICLIDSNANIINKRDILKKYTEVEIINILKTYDNNFITLGYCNNKNNDTSVFCFKFNQDLSPFIRQNIVLRYDSLCTHPVRDTTIELPEPIIVNMLKDSFLKIDDNPSHFVEFKMYPNPSNENITLEIDNPNQDQFIIKCYDLNGKIINLSAEETRKNNYTIFKIYTQFLNNGNYFIEAQSGNTKIFKSFIVNHLD